jgi:hypothetical protein
MDFRFKSKNYKQNITQCFPHYQNTSEAYIKSVQIHCLRVKSL